MTGIEALLLQARLAWDGDEAEKGMSSAGKAATSLQSKISSAMKKIGGAIAAAFTVDAIKNFVVSAIEAGAEVSAEVSAFEQIMGDYTDEANQKMQSIADNTGMVATRLTPYMTSMTAKFKGLGYGVQEATDMAARGLNLAADGAAFWDMSLDESTSHLNSFINGSYEGGEAIGLFANDTQMAMFAVEQGLISSTKEWSALDEATKQATRLEYAENMYEQSGATGQAAKESEQYANVMANLAEKWRQFQAQIGEPIIENIAIPIMKKLGQAIDLLSEGVTYAKDHFAEWKPYIVDAAGALGILATAVVGFKLGTLISNLASMVKGLDLMKIKTVLMTGAQAALNVVLNLNPIGLVVGAIAALVAAFVIAYQKSDTFRAFVDRLWATIGEKLQPVIEAVGDFIQNTLVPAFQSAGEWIMGTLVPAFQAFGEYIITTIVPILQELGAWLQERILSAIQNIASWIRDDLVPTLQSWGSYIMDEIVPALQELGAAIWDRLRPILASISEFVSGTVVPAFRRIIEIVQQILIAATPILEAIRVVFETKFLVVKAVAESIWNGIKVIITTALGVIKGIIQAITAAINGDWTGAWEAIKGVARTIWNGIRGLASVVFNGLKSVITTILNGISEAWSNIWSAIRAVALVIWNSLSSSVRDKITGMADTISEKVEAIKEWMNFSGLVSTVTGIFEDVKGAIEEKIEAAKETVKSIVDSIVGFFTGAKFEWPSIPMPHFGISPSGWGVGDLLKGVIPTLSIDWYAKAMDDAMVLDGATIFGAAGGQMLGGGEAGREVVSGEAHLIELITQAVAQNNAAMLDVLSRILDAIHALNEELYDHIVDALTDGVRFSMDGREFGRLVKSYA